MATAAIIDRNSIDARLRGATLSGEVAGVVAMATNRNDLLYEGCYGVADLASGAALHRDAIFRLRSMTKTITSVGMMQLVERGLVSLEEPVGRLVPQLAAPMVLHGLRRDGSPVLLPAEKQITVRHLLTHTSGLSNPAWSAELLTVTAALRTPPRPNNFEELARTPLLFEPGSRWSYSIGVDILGHVVTAITGQAIDDYLNENVIGPLGMIDTTFTLTPAQRKRLVAVHQRRPDDTLGAGDIPAGNGVEFLAAGGGLCGTAADYLRFLRMLLARGTLDGVRILNADTVEEMSRNQIGDVDVEPMLTAQPSVSFDCDFFPGMTKKWGFAGLINTRPGPNGRHANSFAWAGAANTYFWVDLDAGVAGVFLTQSLPFADPKALSLLSAFERSIYGRD